MMIQLNMKIKRVLYKVILISIVLNSCKDDLKTKITHNDNNIESIEYFNSQNVIQKKTFYSKYGTKVAEFNYKNGSKEVSFLYDDEEKLISKFIYLKDNYCIEIKYDEQGIIGKGKLDNNLNQNGIWQYYDKNDSLKYRINFNTRFSDSVNSEK